MAQAVGNVASIITYILRIYVHRRFECGIKRCTTLGAEICYSNSCVDIEKIIKIIIF